MSFIKYFKIKQLGHKDNLLIFANGHDDIVLEEKIDGSNFRFMIKDKKLILGSRTQELNENRQEEKNWKRCCDFIKKTVKPYKKYEGLIFYGELCRRHTVGYDFEKMPPFLGFDIYDVKNKKFLDYTLAKDIFMHMGIDFVPIIKVVKAGEVAAFTDDDVPKSMYYEGKAEGVVLKNYSAQIFAKHVREEFKEDNKKAFGGTPKYEETDSGLLMARYCTNARIEKIVYKLEQDGHCIQMEMMKLLPKLVYEDIIEEEWRSMLFGHYKIDCRKMKRIVCKRCAAVLKQMMTNCALGNRDTGSDEV